MKKNKIGILLLSGLITGTMLGSGIILLPPIAYNMLSQSAIFAWIAIIITGGLFAGIFTKLGIDFPGDAGIANAVEHAFGKEFKQLTSLFLIFAVLMGPVAVILLGGEYIKLIFPFFRVEIYALILLILCVSILLKNLSSLGKITLVLSSIITATLFIGALTVLFNYDINVSSIDIKEFKTFSKTVLILFWAMVGWEVIANYTEDVDNPKKTVTISVIISFITVSIIFLTVVLALQSIDFSVINQNSDSINLSFILIPAFGKFAVPILSFITVCLCITTYVMFVGGVARLINAQARSGYFPKILGKKSENNAPQNAILLIAGIHCFWLILVYFNLLYIKNLVEFANLFFICNALFGILASMKIYKSLGIFISASILSFIFLILLFFSSKVLLLIALSMLLFTFYKNKKKQKV